MNLYNIFIDNNKVYRPVSYNETNQNSICLLKDPGSENQYKS